MSTHPPLALPIATYHSYSAWSPRFTTPPPHHLPAPPARTTGPALPLRQRRPEEESPYSAAYRPRPRSHPLKVPACPRRPNQCPPKRRRPRRQREWHMPPRVWSRSARETRPRLRGWMPTAHSVGCASSASSKRTSRAIASPRRRRPTPSQPRRSSALGRSRSIRPSPSSRPGSRSRSRSRSPSRSRRSPLGPTPRTPRLWLRSSRHRSNRPPPRPRTRRLRRRSTTLTFEGVAGGAVGAVPPSASKAAVAGGAGVGRHASVHASVRVRRP